MLASFFYDKWSKSMFCLGLFFLCLAPFLIGWIPSIYWGFLIIQKAKSEEQELKTFLDANNVRSDQPNELA